MLTEKDKNSLFVSHLCHSLFIMWEWGGMDEHERGENEKIDLVKMERGNPHSKICLILTQCCSFPHLSLSVFVWLFFLCSLNHLYFFFSPPTTLILLCLLSSSSVCFFMGEVCLFRNLSSFIHASSLFLCSPSSLLWFVINPLFCLRLSPQGFARNPLITLCLLKPLKN